MNNHSNLLCAGAFFILSLSFHVSMAHSEDTNEDILDDGALESLETELQASCGSQRPGDAKLIFSTQILDRTEKLDQVLKRKFMEIHNYFRNPYEYRNAYRGPGDTAPIMHTRDQLQFEVTNLERLERQGQSYEEIEKQRAKVKFVKAELEKQMAVSVKKERFISSERMARARSDMKQLGKWADRLDRVQKRAESCFGYANNFRKSPSDLAAGSADSDSGYTAPAR